MKTAPTLDKLDPDVLGREMHALIAELYPICRSITGNGLRETLRRTQQYIPLTMHEVPTGTRVFDWTVPPEWNIRDAYVKNSRWGADYRFSQIKPARAQLQRAGA